MSQLAEQIAVLDGLSSLGRMDPSDGRIGQRRASVTQYARQIMPGVLARRNVIDASEGANYSGGSSYAPGLPLLPSTIGLAGVPGVLPMRRHVLDPSMGANYTGGSSYAPGMPLVVSSAGLAQADGYGAAGMGYAPSGNYVDRDLSGAFNGLEALRALDPGDGRIGQTRASVTQYAKQVMPGVLMRRNVIDPSEGANYSGGSSYAPGIPLLPSTIGLAGLGESEDALDGLEDLAFTRRLPMRARAAFRKAAGRSVVRGLKSRERAAGQMAQSPNAQRRVRGVNLLARIRARLARVRAARRNVLKRAVIGGVPVTMTRPYSPSAPQMMWK